MAKTPRIYTRLTRPSGSIASYKSLWLAEDHLLIVKSTGYHETYQRLYFRDIKGFFTISSERRLAWGLVWGIVAVISGAMLGFGLQVGKQPVVSGIVCGLTTLFFVWNLLLGPACRMFAVTRVQTAPLALVRRRKAHKVLARVQPLIEAAQRDLVPPPAEPAPPPLA